MTEIYLIRHTQAEGNHYRMMQGHWDGGVTALGRRQIDALAERMKGEKIDAVYSSNMYRTNATAEAITRYHAVPLYMDSRLKEINMGSWEAKFFGNICHSHPEEAALFLSKPQFWQVEGSENYAQVSGRAYAALLDIANKHAGESVAVVSHGVTVRCMLSSALNIPLERLEELPICKNTAVSKLIFENGSFSAEYINDYRHIENVGGFVWSKTADLRDEAIDPALNAEYYTACYKDSWIAAHGSADHFCAGLYLDSAMDHYMADNGAIMKIYDGQDAVGLIDLDTERSAHAGIGWISLLYLREDYRLKGYGAQLLGRAVMKYRELGRRAIRLHVAADNKVALAFYKKHGFKQLSSENNGLGELMLMERSLGVF